MRRALFLFLVLASCLGPTEIVVTISTNACLSLAHTDIYVDGNQVGAAPTPQCDPNDPLAHVDLGNITILPTHGIDSTVDITLVGAVGGACTSPDTKELGCIVARRSLSFIPHTRLDLPIFLDSACAGISCGEGETCVFDDKGAHCSASGCGTADTPPCAVDAGEPDGSPIIDAGVIDATPSCPTIMPMIGTPTLSWSFEQTTTDGVHEDNNVVQPPPPFEVGSKIVAKPPTFGCGTYLTVQAATPQTLLATPSPYVGYFNDPSFALGFAFLALVDGPVFSTPTLAGSGAMGVYIAKGLLSVELQTPNQQNPIYVSPASVLDNKWHRFGIDVSTPSADGGPAALSTVTIFTDGVPGTPFKIPTYMPGAPATVSVGPIAGIDQITYFAR